MPLEDEVELIAYLHELLDDAIHPEMRVIQSNDPYDSPVLVINFNDKLYAIAVEEFPPRENQFGKKVGDTK